MGALIKTRGTKLLAAHLNEEFSTWIAFYRGKANYFDATRAGYNPAGTGGLLYATNNIFAPHSLRTDQKSLLPYFPPGTPHTNLENRWLWFLNTSAANVALGSLMPANDIAIASAIHKALGGAYDSITFDAVETSGPQYVTVSDAYDDGTLYMNIVLMTPKSIPKAGNKATGLLPLD